MTIARHRIAWALSCGAALAVAVLYALISEPHKGERLTDFTKAYYPAGEAILHGGPAALWPLIESAQFVNIPIVAWLFTPFTFLGPTAGKLAFSGLGLIAVLAAYRLIAGFAEARVRPVIFLLFACNGPLWYSLLIGNTTEFVLLLLVVALIAWNRRAGYSAGICLGIAAVIKPMFILFALYFVWRREWRVVLGGATVVGGAVVSCLLVFGLDYTLGWYEHCIAAFAGQPMAAANNQSIDGFILRLWTGPALLRDWNPHQLPAAARAMKDLLVLAIIGSTIAALWRHRRPRSANLASGLSDLDYLEYCLIINICVLTSSISWTHYYAYFLIIYGLHVAGRVPSIRDRMTEGLVATSILLCSIPVRIPWIGAEWLAPISSRSLESVWFIGGCLLLCALLRCSLERDRLRLPAKAPFRWVGRSRPCDPQLLQ